MERKKYPVLVTIQCLVYNHEPYLRKCLDGFVMQQTTFPFEAIVHDDASTDNSAEIIREYAEKYPDIIKPILETENQYSKEDGSLRRIMREATRGKYIAICEGDDYWTDPHKLQMQVSFLESHPDYMMCVTEARVIAPDKTFWEWQTYKEDCEMPTEFIISRGVHYIQTCTYLFKSDIYKEWPDVNNKCCIGDMPLFITCALKGKVYYFACRTGVYRKSFSNDSWNSRINKYSYDKRIAMEKNIADTLFGLNEYSQGKYKQSFYYAVAYLVYNLSKRIHKNANHVVETIIPSSIENEVLETLSKSRQMNIWLWRHHLYLLYVIKHSVSIVIYKIRDHF